MYAARSYIFILRFGNTIVFVKLFTRCDAFGGQKTCYHGLFNTLDDNIQLLLNDVESKITRLHRYYC